MPREAVYMVLQKKGVPSVLISISTSFHDQMSAMVRYEGELGKEIKVQNGLRQGCVVSYIIQHLCRLCNKRMERGNGQ